MRSTAAFFGAAPLSQARRVNHKDCPPMHMPRAPDASQAFHPHPEWCRHGFSLDSIGGPNAFCGGQLRNADVTTPFGTALSSRRPAVACLKARCLGFGDMLEQTPCWSISGSLVCEAKDSMAEDSPSLDVTAAADSTSDTLLGLSESGRQGWSSEQPLRFCMHRRRESFAALEGFF